MNGHCSNIGVVMVSLCCVQEPWSGRSHDHGNTLFHNVHSSRTKSIPGQLGPGHLMFDQAEPMKPAKPTNKAAVLSTWSPNIPRSRASLMEKLAMKISMTLIVYSIFSFACVILSMTVMMILTLNFVNGKVYLPGGELGCSIAKASLKTGITVEKGHGS